MPQVGTGTPVNSAPVFVDATKGTGRMYTSVVPIEIAGVARGQYTVQFFFPDSMSNAEAIAQIEQGFAVRWN